MQLTRLQQLAGLKEQELEEQYDFGLDETSEVLNEGVLDKFLSSEMARKSPIMNAIRGGKFKVAAKESVKRAAEIANEFDELTKIYNGLITHKTVLSQDKNFQEQAKFLEKLSKNFLKVGSSYEDFLNNHLLK